MKIMKPKTKYDWVWVDGEDAPNIDKFIKIETMPKEIECIFPVENYFEEYKTFTK